MSLATKDHLSLIIQAFKALLSRKADKSDLATKIDRGEFEEEDAIKFAADMGFVSPIAANDGSIYTDENGNVFTL